MPACDSSPNRSICTCSDEKLKLTFDAHNNFVDENECQEKDIKLSDLVGHFQALIQKIKDLKLFELIEPITLAMNKLKYLDDLTEKISSDCNYGFYPCDENCLTELCGSTQSESSTSDSCLCRDASGNKACHCDSKTSIDKDKSKNKDKPCETKPSNKKIEQTDKCNPCRCGVDDNSGKRTKTSGCKLAAKERRKKKKENVCMEEKKKKEEENDAKCKDEFSIGAGIAFGVLGLNATFSTARVRNAEDQEVTCHKAVLCDMSEESSSEYSYRANGVAPKGPAARLRYSSSENYLRSKSSLGSCGCGYRGDDEGQSCPCGCGDLMALPKGRLRASRSKSRCRCTDCGKEITGNCRSSKDSRKKRKTRECV